jgi:hypothetical protein
LDSPIVDFDQERIGVVVDVARCQWLHLAKYMVQASVPLWFCWGQSPSYNPRLESWINDDFYFGLGDGDIITVKPTDATGRVLPPVIPNSRQRPGETMEQFFSRRRQRDGNLIRKETTSQRSSRQAREKTQASKPKPGKKGASVFYWEDVDGFRIRTPLARPHVERMWDTWKASQKVYNGFDNCWDCCSLFGDSPGEAELDSDDDHEDIYPRVNPQPPPTAPDQTAPVIESVGQLAADTSSMSVCDREPTSSTQQSTPDTCMSLQGSSNNPSPEQHTPTAQDRSNLLPSPADRGVLLQEAEITEETEDLLFGMTELNTLGAPNDITSRYTSDLFFSTALYLPSPFQNTVVHKCRPTFGLNQT